MVARELFLINAMVARGILELLPTVVGDCQGCYGAFFTIISWLLADVFFNNTWLLGIFFNKNIYLLGLSFNKVMNPIETSV